jgi:hypothetical protein
MKAKNLFHWALRQKAPIAPRDLIKCHSGPTLVVIPPVPSRSYIWCIYWRWSCKILFSAVDCTVYKLKFKIDVI